MTRDLRDLQNTSTLSKRRVQVGIGWDGGTNPESEALDCHERLERILHQHNRSENRLLQQRAIQR